MFKSIIVTLIAFSSFAANAAHVDGFWYTKDGKEITVVGNTLTVNYISNQFTIDNKTTFADVNPVNNHIIVTITENGVTTTYEGNAK